MSAREAVIPQGGLGSEDVWDPFFKWALVDLQENMQSSYGEILETQDYARMRAIAKKAASSAEGQ